MNDNQLQKKYDAAISLLAEWCHAIDTRGASWDDWDKYYKDAAYRPSILREDIDLELANIKAKEEAEKSEYLKYL